MIIDHGASGVTLKRGKMIHQHWTERLQMAGKSTYIPCVAFCSLSCQHKADKTAWTFSGGKKRRKKSESNTPKPYSMKQEDLDKLQPCVEEM
jgi:hypothetical protein